MVKITTKHVFTLLSIPIIILLLSATIVQAQWFCGSYFYPERTYRATVYSNLQ